MHSMTLVQVPSSCFGVCSLVYQFSFPSCMYGSTAGEFYLYRRPSKIKLELDCVLIRNAGIVWHNHMKENKLTSLAGTKKSSSWL